MTLVRNPTKEELATQIALHLGIATPAVSKGSSVDASFLDRVYLRLTGDESDARDAYRKTERVLTALGLTYDIRWDTSEAASRGGSTVTSRAYSRILGQLTSTPRCFLVRWQDARERLFETPPTFHYFLDTSGRRNLNTAGPGSRLMFFSRDESGDDEVFAEAVVEDIATGWSGPWEVTMSGLQPRTLRAGLRRLGLPALRGINEVSELDFLYLLGGSAVDSEIRPSRLEEDHGGALAVERSIAAIDDRDAHPELKLPIRLPAGSFPPREPVVARYQEEVKGGRLVSSELVPQASDRSRAKAAEQRAINLVIRAMRRNGWSLDRDRQADGVGYDLEFSKEAGRVHVEVKGVMSSTLAFNLTPKESWRAETDPYFMVIAVTSVLSPAGYSLHAITRDRLATAKRAITGYRLTFG